MIGPLQEAPGFDTGAGRVLAQSTEAFAALLAAAGLSLSLVIALAMLSVDMLRTLSLTL